MAHLHSLKRKMPRHYLWLFGVLSMYLLSTTNLIGQSSSAGFTQLDFDYVHPDDQQKYTGSFRYQFIVKNSGEDHDISADENVNFSKYKSNEIRILISDLRFEKEPKDGKLYFNKDWVKYPEDKIEFKSARDKELVAGRKRPITMKFDVIRNGRISIQLGYHTIKNLKRGVPQSRTFRFTASGIKEPEKPVSTVSPSVSKPSPSTVPPVAAKETKAPEKSKSKAKKKKKPSEEESAWKVAMKKNKKGAFEGFLKKFPDGKFAEEAKVKIEERKEIEPAEFRIEQISDNEFEIFLENVLNPKIVAAAEDSLVEIKYNFESIEVVLPSGRKEYVLTATDDWGKDIDPIRIDGDISRIEANVTQEEEQLRLSISGGIPPYLLVLSNEENEVIARHPIKGSSKNTEVVIPYEQLAKKLKGNYTIDLLDQRKSISKRFENIEIHQKDSTMILKILMVLGGLILLAVGYFVNRSNQKKKEQKLEIAKQQLQKNKNTGTTPTKQPTTTPVPKTTKSPKRKLKTSSKPVNKIPPKLVVPLAANGERPQMKIRKRSVNAMNIGGNLSNEDFTALVNGPGEYVVINMGGTWSDSAVSDIYLSKQCVKDIDVFIRTTNQIAKEETEDSPPEIGGFLLGSYSFFEDKNQYEISVDKFVSITPEENDVYTVAFGTQAWSQLDDIVVKSGGKSDLIGWFHTHPGHGLFLSQPDLKIHNGFFTQKYKVAIEIETMTPDFDTAFFTRKQNGEVNNTRDRIVNEWHYWTNVERITNKVKT